MSLHHRGLIKAGLSALHYCGANSLVAPIAPRAGVIFAAHRVEPGARKAFDPNRNLTIEPAFLEAVVQKVLDAGYDVIALDDVAARLRQPTARPFACFTFDDGYRDNLHHAMPIFKRRNLPFAIYVPTDYADGTGNLWWHTLEAVVRMSAAITVPFEQGIRRFKAGTPRKKEVAFDQIYWWLRAMPEDCARGVVAELARQAGYDPDDDCRGLIMSFDELRALAADPLVTIAAHTRQHRALAKLEANDALAEIAKSLQRIEAEFDRPCRHFSYPYGCADSAGEREFEIARALGVETAVTTRKGLIQPAHARTMTALPRVSLNGEFQDLRYVETMLSGAPFLLWDAYEQLTRSGNASQRGRAIQATMSPAGGTHASPATT